MTVGRRSILLLLAATCLLSLGLSGCGRADAKPLQVTYYYLPG